MQKPTPLPIRTAPRSARAALRQALADLEATRVRCNPIDALRAWRAAAARRAATPRAAR